MRSAPDLWKPPPELCGEGGSVPAFPGLKLLKGPVLASRDAHASRENLPSTQEGWPILLALERSQPDLPGKPPSRPPVPEPPAWNSRPVHLCWRPRTPGWPQMSSVRSPSPPPAYMGLIQEPVACPVSVAFPWELFSVSENRAQFFWEAFAGVFRGPVGGPSGPPFRS